MFLNVRIVWAHFVVSPSILPHFLLFLGQFTLVYPIFLVSVIGRSVGMPSLVIETQCSPQLK